MQNILGQNANTDTEAEVWVISIIWSRAEKTFLVKYGLGSSENDKKMGNLRGVSLVEGFVFASPPPPPLPQSQSGAFHF